MLGIERPIVQAPMAAIPRLAAAVSNAGALGMVTLTWSADIRAVVRETAALTARPFGGNFVLTEDHHHHLDQALEAGLRIVSFMWGDPSGYIEPVHDDSPGVVHRLDVAAGIPPDKRDDPQAGFEGRLQATVVIFGENKVAAERPRGQRRRLTNDSSGVF